MPVIAAVTIATTRTSATRRNRSAFCMRASGAIPMPVNRKHRLSARTGPTSPPGAKLSTSVGASSAIPAVSTMATLRFVATVRRTPAAVTRQLAISDPVPPASSTAEAVKTTDSASATVPNSLGETSPTSSSSEPYHSTWLETWAIVAHESPRLMVPVSGDWSVGGVVAVKGRQAIPTVRRTLREAVAEAPGQPGRAT